MPYYQTLVPAYGRDYKSKAAVIQDWKNGKDFKAEPQGWYISIKEKPADMIVNIRYAKLTKVVVVK